MNRVSGLERMLLALAAGVYLLGVQLPTFVFDIPLNNELQALDPDPLDETAARAARERFEPRWNRWNAVRTVLAVLTSVLLAILLLRL